MSAQSNTITPRFPFGAVVATPGALEAIAEAGQRPTEFLRLHGQLEQGALSEADHKENLFSLDKRLRLFSAFKTDQDVKVWIITEADRSSTAILLPSEY